MGKLNDFLTKNKNYVISIIVLLLITGLFIGGIMIGKGWKANQDLKQNEADLKKDIKQTEIQVKQSENNAKTLIDSSAIYENFAKRQGIKAAEINKKINIITNDTKTKINNIDFLDRDSNIILFSRYAQDYINTTP